MANADPGPLRLTLAMSRWRIRVAKAAVLGLIVVDWAVPGWLDQEAVTERLARFLVAGAKVTSR